MIMHRNDIDALKGISIIVVVLFHMGLLKSGYLGVDAFFVINGFLVIPSIIKKIHQSEFSFFGFMEKRILRLLPLIVIISAVSLCMGYFLMLPDHYENLAESVVSSNLMSENILSAITTKNYWDVVNEYKPLMHLWYVGVLFEFYIVFPVMMLIANAFAKVLKQDGRTWMVTLLFVLSLCSLILYILPIGASGDKFYYLPYRFFELGIGGCISLIPYKLKMGGVQNSLRSLVFQNTMVCVLIGVLVCSLYSSVFGQNEIGGVVVGGEPNTSNGLPFPSPIALLLTVAFTSVVVACANENRLFLKSRLLATIGKMSYSIFIWHQVLFAFYRYSISDSMDWPAAMSLVIITIIISTISYYFIEKKITISHRSFACWAFASACVIWSSLYLYAHAGVVRDVPELDIVKGTEHRGMYGEYCDRIYQYKDFPKQDNGKPNVLVANISFGRDFANILLESDYADSINLAYLYVWTNEKAEELVVKSDYIFAFSAKDKLPSFVWTSKKASCKVMGISTKNYGSCNGIIYKHRNDKDYFSYTVPIQPGYKELNQLWKQQWGEENYIDLLTPSLIDNNHVRVFTDDHRYISQDCRHLTQAGARWYAKTLNWKSIFNR